MICIFVYYLWTNFVLVNHTQRVQVTYTLIIRCDQNKYWHGIGLGDLKDMPLSRWEELTVEDCHVGSRVIESASKWPK